MEEIAKQIARDYGITGLSLVGLAYMAFIIGRRIVAAIDKLADKADANAKSLTDKADANAKSITDAFAIASKEIALSIATHTASVSTRISELQASTGDKVGQLSERVARVEAKLDMQDDVTPVTGVPIPFRHRTSG